MSVFLNSLLDALFNIGPNGEKHREAFRKNYIYNFHFSLNEFMYKTNIV